MCSRTTLAGLIVAGVLAVHGFDASAQELNVTIGPGG